MKYYISITDENGILKDRFRIIDSSSEEGMKAICEVEPGEEDAETEAVPSPMSVASLVHRIQKSMSR